MEQELQTQGRREVVCREAAQGYPGPFWSWITPVPRASFELFISFSQVSAWQSLPVRPKEGRDLPFLGICSKDPRQIRGCLPTSLDRCPTRIPKATVHRVDSLQLQWWDQAATYSPGSHLQYLLTWVAPRSGGFGLSSSFEGQCSNRSEL